MKFFESLNKKDNEEVFTHTYTPTLGLVLLVSLRAHMFLELI